MAKPELGTKRLCAGCGAKFYDLNHSPILCPKCGTVYEVAPAVRGRGGEPARAAVAEEAAPEAAETEFVSLEEADAESKTGKVAADLPEDDIELEETLEDDDDSTFIPEEEEGEDDVTDIIGDVDSDEET